MAAETHRRPLVYLAGPDVFLPRAEALALAEEKKKICAELGLEGIFPFDVEAQKPPAGTAGEQQALLARNIARKDEALVRRCDAVLANATPFRGPSMDVGTAYEVGFARGLGRPVFGYSNDGRSYAARVSEHCGGDDSSKDANGFTVEPFGCGENLMLHGAFCAQEAAGGSCAGAAVAADGAVQGGMHEIASFRLAAQQAADYLLKGVCAVVDGEGK